MPVLMKAANMICAVLRNGERLAAAAREGGGGGRGDRGPPRNNGAGSGGGDRRGGPTPYNPSGPPPSSQAQPSPASVNYQYQQQQPVSKETRLSKQLCYSRVDRGSLRGGRRV